MFLYDFIPEAVDKCAHICLLRVKGKTLLDLNYLEDAAADVDMNVVMTGSGQFIEVQGTGEEATFSRTELDSLLRSATRGIKQLIEIQCKALRKRL